LKLNRNVGAFQFNNHIKEIFNK